MNNIFKNIMRGALCLGVALLAACTPDKYDGPTKGGIPQAEDIQAEVVLDQAVNQYTLILHNKGVYPIWKIYTAPDKYTISTENGKTGIIPVAGTYHVEVRIGNANGVCEGSKTLEFTFDNSQIDYAPYLARLTGGESKTWVVAKDVAGHFGCGESGTEGVNWWSAQPDEKKDWGVYDDSFIFTLTDDAEGGDYTFNPGEGGMIYVNTGITDLPPYSNYNPNDGADYNAPAEEQNTTFKFVTEGTDLYLQFPAGTLLGYLPNVEAYNNPKFKVNKLTGDQLDLTVDNGSIAWHYLFTLPGEPAFQGFKYDSQFNLWKDATVAGPTFYYAPGWSQLPDPEYSLDGNRGITVTLPSATTDQWQAQTFLVADITTSAANTYDFSCVINSNQDMAGVTVKLCKDGDDGAFIFDAKPGPIKANQDYVFYVTDQPGIDADKLKLVLDFGGNPDNTTITVSNIVLKNHADDDGTVLPVEPDQPTVDWNNNIWAAVPFADFEYYYANPDWAQIDNPEAVDNGDGSYSFKFATATTQQWQAQVKIGSTTNTTAEKSYDFHIVIESNQDFTGATVKFVKPGDDNTFYMADRMALKAYENNEFQWVGLPGIDIENLLLVLDFGGCPDDTEITVKEIYVQEHVGE